MAIGAAKAKGPATKRSADLSTRLGLTVPHEWWPSAHMLKSYEAAGFAYVQIDAPPVSVLADSRLVTRHAGATRAALDTTTLGCVIHAPHGVRLGTAAGDKAMDGLIEYAAEVGAAQIVYHALAIADEPHTRDACRYEEISLRRAATRCARLGQTLAIENLAPLYPGPETVSATPANLRTVVRRAGSPGLGLCLDLGHAHVIAERRRTSLARLVEPVLDVVTLFHAHDNFGARLGGQNGRTLGVDPLRLDLHLPPGRGTLPWHEVADPVAAHRAPVILEVHPPYRRRGDELHEDALLLLRSG